MSGRGKRLLSLAFALLTWTLVSRPQPADAQGSCATVCSAKRSCNTPCTNGGRTTTCGQYGKCFIGTPTVDRFDFRVILRSRARRLVNGMDGGHNEKYCSIIDTPYNQCTGFNGNKMDGLQLVPASASFQGGLGGVRSFDTYHRPIEGPYQLENSKWEWKEGVGDWTYRTTDIVDMRWSNVNWSTASSSSAYRFWWKELDPVPLCGDCDDDFLWTVDFKNMINTAIAMGCSRAPLYQVAGSGTVGTWRVIATNQVIRNASSTQYLCDTRGCGDGQYEVRYDIFAVCGKY